MHPEALPPKSKGIFPHLSHFPAFVLAGGTALALQIGHRVSVDFDFFLHEKLLPEDLLQSMQDVFRGKALEPLVNNREEVSALVEGVKITFLHYPFPLLFPPVPYGGIELLSVKEIAATKAYTIGRRGSLKDYVDLYFILSENHASLQEILAYAEKKYGPHFNGRLFLEQIIYLEDVEETPVTFLKSPVSKQTLQNFFEERIRGIAV